MDAPFFICSCLATIERRTWNRDKKKTAYLTTNGSVKTNYLKTNLLKQIKKIFLCFVICCVQYELLMIFLF